ncbi:IS110 family transposase [Paenibacillus melissococcoides]|uniref:IS110 family transposase n=1 Tax=Paenibacillus melissococcoides TaxID=2912268 RepID=A0ABN8U9T5_9BACL|nr:MULTISPECIES: IS110 family transposase [Paenibacillus]MEB9892289.1 IS110 family transposase [Bacillus cereus]CAH8247879.1 IS110 family transposase [Paenibacillus melissococcoides]CAH8719270.1 IS110 family transposase [Paenibacillus melissococcoides]CAH8720281.1 IS110 family transposase [Paenibacillus melissococcoides]GIO78835.1 IS110 family transposase [Paenibacillus dendritiformis]
MKHKLKQKQNQRITRITDSTLVVGADIAKKIHVARAVDFRGIELGKDCVFPNDQQGLTKLTTWMKELGQAHSKTDIVFGIEPTGHYWFPLAAYLHAQGIQIVVVNPHHVNKSKELEDNSQTKSDYKDAKVIADLIRNGKYSEPKLPTKEYADLRILMNLREKVSASLTQVKGRIGHWFDRFFPEYSTVCKDWDGKTSLMTMRSFPLPSDIVSKSAREVLAHWKTEVKRGVGIKRAEKLVAAAAASIGLTEGSAAARIELSTLLGQFELFREQLEGIMKEVTQILENIPGAEHMLSVPGVGTVTVAGFLAEVGDLSNYDHGQQIIRLAGLNLKENSSGKRKGKTGISKRGRSRLRALLFRAVMPMLAKNEAFKTLQKHYTNRSQNPLKKKQSLIALCGKLIRVLHTLGTKQRAYNADEMLGPVRQSQMQLEAA